MKILAIETSCDETGIAVVEGMQQGETLTFTILKNTLLSQAALHAEYGGVYPNLAKREHEKNLPVLYREFAGDQVDAVAVTAGPGLEPALWTGIEFAKRVARERGVSLLPVNHMEGHLISSLAQPDPTNKQHSDILKNIRMLLVNVQLPVLALLISGGHTEFVLMREWFTYEVVGKTLDDAVGECFDKVARMLGLPYPGGPHIGRIAQLHREAKQESSRENSLARENSPKRELRDGRPEDFFEGSFPAKLPRPMLNSGTCDFSFSGLKTAALYALRDRGGIQTLSASEIAAFAAEFEEAVGDVLVSKTRQALEQTSAQTFVIGGGVAASIYLRERLQKLLADEFPNVEMRLPDLSITGDNAIMIAEAALARALSGKNDKADETLRAAGNLSIESK